MVLTRGSLSTRQELDEPVGGDVVADPLPISISTPWLRWKSDFVPATHHTPPAACRPRSLSPNSDVLVGDKGDDINIWAPGDGSDAFTGNEDKDTMIFAPFVENATARCC